MNTCLHSIPATLRIALFALTSAGLLAGCAGTSTRPAVDWRNGAHRATIVSLYPANAEPSTLPPCLAALPDSEYAAHRFVKVRYHHVRLHHSVVAMLPDGQRAGIGDQVELWPADCATGQLSRISQVLSVPVAPGNPP